MEKEGVRFQQPVANLFQSLNHPHYLISKGPPTKVKASGSS